ncbi:zinc finger protein 420-like [Cyprinodon tularosa]|uniref:zinc finger protein 420-like n=1 Tax=Cyprinodon tularosa TaxID=77115 RepID=UPI0018E23578|nr:zinc finger protein 420-like [Cyprinodon tularosa]
MEAGEKMSKLELLSVFLNERLAAAAAEIFGAVKDAVAEQQRENQRLRKLLHAAAQRLQLQLHPEPLSVHLQEKTQLCEPDGSSNMELIPQVKQESTVTQTESDNTQQTDEAVEGVCFNNEQQTSCPPLVSNVSAPPQTCMETKMENTEEEKELTHGSSPVAVPVDCRAAFSPAKSPKNLRTNVEGKGALRSNSKQSMHPLPLKNIRSLKQPLSRSFYPNQSTQRWHSCKECGKTFSFACQLEVHMRWHTKEKPYSCAVCKKSFTTVSMLKRHHRIHTGEKPFRCHVCGKCFNQSAHLNTHYRLHTREGASWGRTALCQ